MAKNEDLTDKKQTKSDTDDKEKDTLADMSSDENMSTVKSNKVKRNVK